MKKLLFILCLFSCVSINAQEKGYWLVFNFRVDKQSDEKELLMAMDYFLSSKQLSQNPLTVAVTQTASANSTTNFTHQIFFLSPNADNFKNWGEGDMGSFAEGKLLEKVFESVKPISSEVGSPLISDPTGLKYKYATIWGFKVTDVPKFASLAAEFISANQLSNGVIELHEAISGAPEGVTHYMVARSNNLGEFLRARETVNANPKTRVWFDNYSKYSTMISSFSHKILKLYQPQKK